MRESRVLAAHAEQNCGGQAVARRLTHVVASDRPSQSHATRAKWAGGPVGRRAKAMVSDEGSKS